MNTIKQSAVFTDIRTGFAFNFSSCVGELLGNIFVQQDRIPPHSSVLPIVTIISVTWLIPLGGGKGGGGQNRPRISGTLIRESN
jgi:hypothetical protein